MPVLRSEHVLHLATREIDAVHGEDAVAHLGLGLGLGLGLVVWMLRLPVHRGLTLALILTTPTWMLALTLTLNPSP